MRNKKVLILVECACMVALAFALSWVKLWKMPLGGSVTLCSMLPILFIAVKYGPAIGLGTAGVYSLTQFAQGLIQGDVSAVSMSLDVFIIASLFDYILPYVVLGIAGIFRKKSDTGVIIGMCLAVFLRFLCHYFTGVTIWSQWTPDGWSAWIYSAAYNGGYLLPDFALTLTVAIIMLKQRQIRRLVGLSA